MRYQRLKFYHAHFPGLRRGKKNPINVAIFIAQHEGEIDFLLSSGDSFPD